MNRKPKLERSGWRSGVKTLERTRMGSASGSCDAPASCDRPEADILRTSSDRVSEVSLASHCTMTSARSHSPSAEIG